MRTSNRFFTTYTTRDEAAEHAARLSRGTNAYEYEAAPYSWYGAGAVETYGIKVYRKVTDCPNMVRVFETFLQA